MASNNTVTRKSFILKGSLGFPMKGAGFGGASVRTHARTPKSGYPPRRFLKSLLKSVEVCLVALLLLVSPAPALALSLPLEEDNSSTAVANSVKGEFIETTLPDYQSFVTMVRNGEQGVLRGVYVPGVLALPVVQQPLGNPGFVSQRNNELTQFSMATEVGNVGLLAHNFLSGATFTNLSVGQEVRLIYGDGTVEYFEIDQILRYQALAL